jgi:NAD-dependent SIR2 family protein deacetylase
MHNLRHPAPERHSVLHGVIQTDAMPCPAAALRESGHGLVSALADFLADAGSVVVLSGAGVSTASGIPDYRDRDGEWKHAQPIQFGPFVRSEETRRRYWARSYVGWQRFSAAQPNAAHLAIAELEKVVDVDRLITQNVDGLHAVAGSRNIIELHGELSKVRCIGCDSITPRAEFQQSLQAENLNWHADVFRYNPDGDAELAGDNYRDFVVPACAGCGGIIKPDVVMFGETVPKDRVGEAVAAVERANALLVIGSSLMVFSGFRFARLAAAAKKPIAIVNQGRTRADDIATLKVDDDCAAVLGAALEMLA